MKLSIIIPVYNMASDDKLIFCLDSVLSQSISSSDYEIIAVDDCSTDDSLSILKKYESDNPGRFVILSTDKNHRQGGAKNVGLAAAKGEWISFIDSDDWIAKDFYEKLFAKADETGADMVGCDYCFTGRHSFEQGQRVASNHEDQTGVMDEARYKKLLIETGSLVVKIYRRNIILGDYVPGSKTKVDVFPEDIFYEDNAVGNTWMLRSSHFEYIPEALYYYYQHDDSTVHTVSLERLFDRMTAGRLIVSEAKKSGYFDKYSEELEYQFTVLFYKNTLFSAMPKKTGLRKKCYSFTGKLALEMKKTFPDFQQNPYYLEKVHPEERKLMALQMRSQLLFYVYYRLLWFYRDLRSGKSNN